MVLQWLGSRAKRPVAKILLGLIVLVLVLLGLSAWLVPKVVRSALTGDVSTMLGRQISVGDIGFNPFTLTLRAHELSIDQPGAAPLLEVVEVDVSASWASLYRLAPVVDRVRVSQPKLTLVREGVTQFNFSDIQRRLAEMSAGKPPEPPSTEPPRFSLNNMLLEDGAISLDDHVTGRHQVIDEIRVGLPFVSTFHYATDIDVLPRVHLRVNGSPLDLNGTARPFEKVPSYSLKMAFAGLDLEKWADVWPMPLPVKLHQGLLDSNLQILFEQPPEATPRIRVLGDVGVRDFDLREKSGAPLLAWNDLQVQRIALEPLAQTLDIGVVQMMAPRAEVHRDAQQQLNWLRVMDGFTHMADAAATPTPTASADPAAAPAPAPAPAAEANGAPAPASADSAAGAAPAKAVPAASATPTAPASGEGKPQAPAQAADTSPQAWKVHVGGVGLVDADAHILDEPFKLDYHLHKLSVAVNDVSVPLAEGQPVDVSAYMRNPDDGSELRLTAPLVVQPLSVDADLDLRGLALTPFAGVVNGFAPVQLLDGKLGLQAHLKVANAQASAQNVKLDLANLSLRDEGVKPAIPVSVASLALTADQLSLGPQPSAFTLDVNGIQGEGSLALAGTLVSQPLSLKTSVDLAKLNLASFAPYIASSLNATVRSVSVGAKGQAEFTAAEGRTPLRAGWRGGVEVNDFNLEDRVNQADFLNWKHLGLSKMDISVAGQRMGLNLGDIVLEDFYGNVLLNSKARLNVMDLVAAPGQAGGSITQDTQTRAPSKPAPAASASGGMPDIAIGSVTLKRGRMTFHDYFVRPNYSAELSGVEGSVSAVSSTKPTPARVKVGGRVYGSAPFSVSGTVQPFSKFLSLDLQSSTKGLDLPRFNTYASKYVGYPIKRGKLSLDIHYQIKDRALQASNRVVLNQLTFGDKTNSPDAIQLPVLLAVSLLKDSHGNIDLNLPISGSLDDPQFSIGGIVWQVISNLLTKAITAPFQLLASAFGGDEELSYIEFEPGSAVIGDEAKQSIETLSKALNDRPALKLDITGRVDPDEDMAALRRAWLDGKMRQAKAHDTGGKGAKSDPSKVQISDSERLKYLEEVYDDTDIKDKPRNFIGMSKSIPPEQMETLLLEAAPVRASALRELADARAQAVAEALQAQGPVDRIFVVEPKLDADGIDDGGKPTRVDFSLK